MDVEPNERRVLGPTYVSSSGSKDVTREESIC